MAETTDTPAKEKAPAPPKEPVRRLSREASTCSKEGCKRPYRAKGYCNVHYSAWRRGELEDHKSRYKRCTKEGCKKPRTAPGSLCEEHGKAARAENAA